MIYIGYMTDDNVPTQPLPKQVLLHTRFKDNKHSLGDGSFGWGKTDAMVLRCIDEAMKYPGNVCLLGRKFLSSFLTSTLDSLLAHLPDELILRHNKQEHEIELIPPYRSKILYMQLDASREALKKINSMNLGFFGVDQIEEIEEEVFLALNGRLRRKRSSRKSLSTCNPNGHSWVYHRFVRHKGPEQNDYGHVSGHIWKEGIPAPTCQEEVIIEYCDNPYLDWDYIRDMLLNMPDRWVKRYIYGDWDNFEATIWPEAKAEPWADGGHIVKPFNIPDWWNRYVILDHGHRNPTAVLFVAVDGDGNWWIYDCHHAAGYWVDYHAAIIKTKIGDDNIYGYLADPTIFDEHESEATIGRQYEDLGLYFEKANRDVPGGIDNVGRAFKERRIRVFDLPQFDPFWTEVLDYSWDDIGRSLSEKERPKKINDHFPDVLRYMANHLYASLQPEKPKPYRWHRRSLDSRGYMGV